MSTSSTSFEPKDFRRVSSLYRPPLAKLTRTQKYPILILRQDSILSNYEIGEQNLKSFLTKTFQIEKLKPYLHSSKGV